MRLSYLFFTYEWLDGALKLTSAVKPQEFTYRMH